MGEAFPMNGGDGAYSYTKNSQYQKQGSDSVKEMIQDSVLEKLDAISSTVAIADLGCSVGPNTFFTVQNLIEAVQNKFSGQNMEFQVYFNDHSKNDFNTLFASLPESRQYHAAGVPGSFHGRLFPRASINVAHSSYALQWLSKQPQGVSNAGRIHYGGAPTEVKRAYLDQYEKDMGAFMSARADEIVSGGLMFLIVPGISEGVSHSDIPAGVLYSYLGYSLMELVKEGVVDEAKVEAFNLPIYDPTAGEIRKVIEKNGWFSIERMELTSPLSQIEIDVGSLIMQLRAATQGILTAYFGTSAVDKMFAKITATSDEMSRRLEAASHPSISTQLFIVLKRK